MSIWSRFTKPFRHTAEPVQRRSFEAASGRRFGGVASYGPHGPETTSAGPVVRGRARHAFANNGYIRNAVSGTVAETVGAGIEANSAHPDPTIRRAIDTTFLEAATAIDADGRTDLRGLTAAAVQAEFVDGEAFFALEYREGRLALRQIPAEWIDESHTTELTGGGYIVAGIEFNPLGERMAYHVRPSRPTDLYPTAGERIRIAAEDMLHVFRSLGPGQVRGVSQLAPVLLALNEADQLQDARLVGSKVAAMFAGFITDMNATGGLQFDGDQTGNILESGLEPGTLKVLPAGVDIKFSAPDQARDSNAFAEEIRGLIAAGLGCPRHILDGDLTGANYSSLRAGLLPWRAKIEQYVYQTLIPQFLDPIFKRIVTDAYLSGRLDAPDLMDAIKAEWLPPRPMQVDPQKDAKALRELLSLGLTSRRQAVASLGWNIDDLDAEIAADRERETVLGLSFSDPKKDQSDAA
uniref:phage portal protein n=1 Tax=Pararhizobium sp. IMCC3301 TaxID=3067904 RepID=UPI002740852B|nr:phage portal protein [Pararhizobium sp. IMCC3301]